MFTRTAFPVLRASAARRSLSSTPKRFANPSTTSDVGTTGGSGDATTADAKNSLYPVFMAIGVATIAYLGYSNVSQRKADNKANAEAPHDEQTTKRPLGEKEKLSSRG